MLAYWIESYKRAHLRNVTEQARITGIELAAVVSDRYYDAVTVRVRATGLDYTVTDDGKVVSGSKTTEQPYSEYWTLIRGSGASHQGTPPPWTPSLADTTSAPTAAPPSPSTWRGAAPTAAPRSPPASSTGSSAGSSRTRLTSGGRDPHTQRSARYQARVRATPSATSTWGT